MLGREEVEGLFPVGRQLKAHQARLDVVVVKPKVAQVVENRLAVNGNGGRTVTEDVEIPFGEETVEDAEMDAGKTEVRQLGEVGTK
ncbi:MAG: G5 domain-containing protein, partial [Clostridia bacterium]|nr:G5 domain-containing protein [Clostridia bacterium]